MADDGEVEDILLMQLRGAGCDISSSLKSVAEFNSPTLVRVCSQCLRKISPDNDFPEELPTEMSSRFKACNGMVAAIKGLGFQGELGFQQFFYPDDKEIPKLLMFLVEQLPKSHVEASEEVIGDSTARHRRLVTILKKWAGKSWVPPLEKGPGQQAVPFHTSALILPSVNKTTTNKDNVSFFKNHLNFLSEQPAKRPDLSASVLEHSLTAQLQYQAVLDLNNSFALDGSEQKSAKATKAERQKVLTTAIRSAVAVGLAQRKVGARSGYAAFTSSVKDELARKRQKASLFAHQTEFAQEKTDTKEMVVTSNETAKAGETAEPAFAVAASVPKASVPKGPSKEELEAEVAQKEKERQQKFDEEKQELQTKVTSTAEALQQLENRVEIQKAEISQFEAMLHSETEKTVPMEEDYKLKKKTLDLLDDVDNNVNDLKGIIATSSERLAELGQEWEQHRKPLFENYRRMKDGLAQRKVECKIKLEQVKAMRDEMGNVQNAIREKDEYAQQLAGEYEKMPKNVNRTAYTRRIMEIVKNIKKQKTEINRILDDTRSVQKEINSASQTLGRTFAAADEMLFKDAKKDEYSKQAYKSLAAMHDAFQKLSLHVEETGQTRNSVRELEAAVEKLKASNSNLNMERVISDLEKIKAENQQLARKVGRA